MSITIECPACGKGLKTKDELAGVTIKCPSCAQRIVVPEGEGEDVDDRPRMRPRAHGKNQRRRRGLEEKRKGAWFRRSEYAAFLLGMFIFSGLLIMPLVTMGLARLQRLEVGYWTAVLGGLAGCVILTIALRRDGTFSIARFAIALVLIFPAIVFLQLIMINPGDSQVGKAIGIAGPACGVLNLLLSWVCGQAGVLIGRVFGGIRRILEERMSSDGEDEAPN